MCLSTVYYGKRKQKALDALPENITGWKQVIRGSKYFRTYQRELRLKIGEVQYFTTNQISMGYFGKKLKRYTYKGGCHIYLKKPKNTWPKVLKVKLKKKDIQTIGCQDGLCVTVDRCKFVKPKTA